VVGVYSTLTYLYKKLKNTRAERTDPRHKGGLSSERLACERAKVRQEAMWLPVLNARRRRYRRAFRCHIHVSCVMYMYMYVCEDSAAPAHARTRAHSTTQSRGATPELRHVCVWLRINKLLYYII